MKTRKLKLLPIAAAMAFGASLAGNAQAAVYAVSYDGLFDFVIKPLAGDEGKFIFDLPNQIFNSNASATLNGVGVVSGGAGVKDAPAANAPLSDVTRLNNVYNFFGATGDKYSNADASIDHEITSLAPPDNYIQTQNIVEGRLASTGTANAESGNSSITDFVIGLTVTGPGVLTFEGLAIPIMQVIVDPLSGLGSFANASISASIRIDQIDLITGLTTNVFNWTPDGAAGGIFGGTEHDDEATLNTVIGRTALFAGTTTYDPTGYFGGANTCTGSVVNGHASGPGVAAADACKYAAETFSLANGTYTITLSMNEKNNMSLVQVPEPATLGLLGLGLLGMGATLRRRKA